MSNFRKIFSFKCSHSFCQTCLRKFFKFIYVVFWI
ncbi:hypothetical protein [uncultured Fusobacterium sp.]